MKTNIKKKGLAVLITFVLMGFGAVAQADTIEGTIQGFTCITHGKVCPIDRLDPHVAAEKLFVVAGNDHGYFFISNIDRSVLARRVLSKVRVSGKTSPKYKSIEANQLEVYTAGNWKTVWSTEMQMKEDAMLNLGT
jgi:hypothetical protein